MSKNIITVLAGIAATILLVAGAGTAAATPGQYTRGGDVLVTVAVSGGCATVTRPRGTTSTTCDYDQVTHEAIVPGDTFGASIVSYTGGGVACSVLDVESGDVVFQDSALPGDTADCIRHAS